MEMKELDFYKIKIYYVINGEIVYWRLKDDIMKRISLLDNFKPFLEYKFQDIETLNLKQLSKIKKIKIFNKDNQYLGIDKSNDRIIYYDKTRYKLCREKSYDTIPIAFYLPYLHMDLLERVADCVNDNGLNFWIARLIYKNCNNNKAEMDMDTLIFIIKEYRKYIKGEKK